MRYTAETGTLMVDRGLGFVPVQAPPAPAMDGLGAAPTCGASPHWEKSMGKGLICVCGTGMDKARCPGCCGACPSCKGQQCQQPPQRVFPTSELPTFDCKCGPCWPTP